MSTNTAQTTVYSNPQEKQKQLSVSKAAAFLGISSSTLRNYEKEGRINSHRLDNGYRVFDTQELKTLKEDIKKDRAVKKTKIKLAQQERIRKYRKKKYGTGVIKNELNYAKDTNQSKLTNLIQEATREVKENFEAKNESKENIESKENAATANNNVRTAEALVQAKELLTNEETSLPKDTVLPTNSRKTPNQIPLLDKLNSGRQSHLTRDTLQEALKKLDAKELALGEASKNQTIKAQESENQTDVEAKNLIRTNEVKSTTKALAQNHVTQNPIKKYGTREEDKIKSRKTLLGESKAKIKKATVYASVLTLLLFLTIISSFGFLYIVGSKTDDSDQSTTAGLVAGANIPRNITQQFAGPLPQGDVLGYNVKKGNYDIFMHLVTDFLENAFFRKNIQVVGDSSLAGILDVTGLSTLAGGIETPTLTFTGTGTMKS